MTANPLSRLVRRAFPGRNPLATTFDRIEGAVLALGVVVGLLAIPAAGAMGSEIYARSESRVDTEQQTRTRAGAVLVEDAGPMSGAVHNDGMVETTSVAATWRAVDGTTRQGAVQAPYNTKAGTTLPIWIDRGGDVTEPPMTHDGAVFYAIISALLLWSVLVGAMASLYVVVRFAHMKVRLRWWRLEWELTAPDWTGR